MAVNVGDWVLRTGNNPNNKVMKPVGLIGQVNRVIGDLFTVAQWRGHNSEVYTKKLEVGEMIENLAVGDIIGFEGHPFHYRVRELGVDGDPNAIIVTYVAGNGAEVDLRTDANIFTRVFERAAHQVGEEVVPALDPWNPRAERAAEIRRNIDQMRGELGAQFRPLPVPPVPAFNPELAELEVGDIVQIKPGTKYFGRDPHHNPAGQDGVVTKIRDEGDLDFQVDWLHSRRSNCYNRKDLLLVRRPEGGEIKEAKKAPDEGTLEAKVAKAVKMLKGRVGTADYAAIHKGGVHRFNNTACHAGLGSYGARDLVDIERIVSSVAQGIDKYPLFYEWLIDRSVWSSVFESRYEWAKEHKCVVAYADVASNFLVSALIATRQGWEFGNLDVWKELVRVGVPEEFALHLSSATSVNKDGTFNVAVSNPGHWPFDGSTHLEYVRGMITKVPTNLRGPYNEVKTYNNVNMVWGDKKGEDVINWLPTVPVEFFGREEQRTNNITGAQLVEWVEKIKKELNK